MIDSGTTAILISQIPIATVFAFFVVRPPATKAAWSIIIGTLALTDFYIIAIDPSLVNALYLQQGNYTYPLEIAGLSAALLLVAVGLFGRGIEEASE